MKNLHKKTTVEKWDSLASCFLLVGKRVTCLKNGMSGYPALKHFQL
jgi:hypothetical protein